MNSNSIKRSPEDIYKDINELKISETKKISDKINKSVQLIKLYTELSYSNIGTKSNR